MLLLLLLLIHLIEKPNYTEFKGTEYYVFFFFFFFFTLYTFIIFKWLFTCNWTHIRQCKELSKNVRIHLAYVGCARGMGELNVQIRIDARIQYYRIM